MKLQGILIGCDVDLFSYTGHEVRGEKLAPVPKAFGMKLQRLTAKQESDLNKKCVTKETRDGFDVEVPDRTGLLKAIRDTAIRGWYGLTVQVIRAVCPPDPDECLDLPDPDERGEIPFAPDHVVLPGVRFIDYLFDRARLSDIENPFWEGYRTLSRKYAEAEEAAQRRLLRPGEDQGGPAPTAELPGV